MVRRTRKKRKSRAKGIRLAEQYWLRNATDIKKYRERQLLKQGGECAVCKAPISVGTLDHTHSGGAGCDGHIRGVLSIEANFLEGKYLKLFKH